MPVCPDFFPFTFHEIVRANGYPNSLLDPSYGYRVDAANAVAAEVAWEDQSLNQFQNNDLVWQNNTAGKDLNYIDQPRPNK